MSAPNGTARLINVQESIKDLWPPRADGRWAALEDAVLKILEAEEKGKPLNGKPGGAAPRDARSQARPAGDKVISLAGRNVIPFAERAARMRRKA